jgi:hypothetical protein
MSVPQTLPCLQGGDIHEPSSRAKKKRGKARPKMKGPKVNDKTTIKEQPARVENEDKRNQDRLLTRLTNVKMGGFHHREKIVVIQAFVRRVMVQTVVGAIIKKKREKLQKLRSKKMLVALPGTTQGDTGWYESPDNVAHQKMCMYCDHNHTTNMWRCLLGPIEEGSKMNMIRAAKATGKVALCNDHLSGTPAPDTYHINAKGKLVAVRKRDGRQTRIEKLPPPKRQSKIARRTRIENGKNATLEEGQAKTKLADGKDEC